MRQVQKKQAEDFVDLLKEAHEEIKKYIDKQSYEEAMELLGQCQSGAIQLGSLVEATEGESCPTIGILESYCEIVYKIYEKIAQNQSVNAEKEYKNLSKYLQKIEDSIQNEIPVFREVVFLPYKASMWDSLESIWKAAEEDPFCHASVIPIPYYDKNPDGSFREMHYEGTQYPDYVPVTWYKDYDFEKRRPDMIFIHNPYDECNYVTSVHPDFYTKELKKYTEKLVYVPYFILDEIKPDDLQVVESMKHFCIAPGVLNADSVIVQSEDMRQVYINVLTEALGENTRNIWEKKILGYGSPKFDKVLNTGKDDIEIPEEWLQIIEKPDGSRKKIVFYNTSVTALLKHNEKMLEKMKNVFQIFKSYQDEVLLLWRPHPLIKATIESMRPEFWEKYKKLAEAYQADGWGIYDDSADVDRAIALSDAYYGDGSSVVQLYLETGKPVMMQDV